MYHQVYPLPLCSLFSSWVLFPQLALVSLTFLWLIHTHTITCVYANEHLHIDTLYMTIKMYIFFYMSTYQIHCINIVQFHFQLHRHWQCVVIILVNICIQYIAYNIYTCIHMQLLTRICNVRHNYNNKCNIHVHVYVQYI